MKIENRAAALMAVTALLASLLALAGCSHKAESAPSYRQTQAASAPGANGAPADPNSRGRMAPPLPGSAPAPGAPAR